MSKGKKTSWYSAVFPPFTCCFKAKANGKEFIASTRMPSAPEAANIAAAKHFSSAHKTSLG